jgi:hypothetical protein
MLVGGQSMPTKFCREGTDIEMSQNYESYFENVQPALQSKQEEFKLLGYDSVSEMDIWDYLVKKKWKKEKEDPKVSRIVQSILSLKVGEFMNYKAVEALKDTSFSLENDEDRLELLK